MRPVLIPGNQVEAALSARTDTQLAQGSIELAHSRSSLLSEPLPAAAIDWVCALTASVLPEGQPYPRLYDALDGLLAAVEAAPSARFWAAALVRYELLVLSELGSNAANGAAPGTEARIESWLDAGVLHLAVANRVEEATTDIQRWDLDDQLRGGGRGLLIVRAYTDSMEIDTAGGEVSVRCTRRLDQPG